MSLNGLGQFLVNSAGQPVVSGTTISSTVFNALTADLATALSTALYKDGQATATAIIPFALGLSSAALVDISAGTAGQIKFPATQNPSANVNTLDDYEEGTFAPTLFGGTVAGTPSYTLQRGNYRKIGNTVWVWGEVSGSLSGATGVLVMGAFPFAQDNTANDLGTLSIPMWGGFTLTAGYTMIGLQMIINTATAQFYESGSGSALIQMGQSQAGTIDFTFTGCYQAAN